MSELKGKIGTFELAFRGVPRGNQGSTQVQLKDGRIIQVAWRRDQDGLRIELPYGSFGFDLEGSVDDDGRVAYRVSQRGSYGEWSEVSFLRGSEQSVAAASTGQRKGMRVRAQMPGKIIRILVKPGTMVEKGQPLLVMEAMKMENEIKAPQAGKVGAMKVSEGQAVETGADLLVVDPE